MSLKLTKTEKVDGETWYYIMLNGSCELATMNEKEAGRKFEEFKERLAKGYPKSTILKSL